MPYDRRDLKAARRMAAAYATLEAMHTARGSADEPLCRELSSWARDHRTRLESRIDAALERDPLTLSLPFDK
jgi:hypothetical protein